MNFPLASLDKITFVNLPKEGMKGLCPIVIISGPEKEYRIIIKIKEPSKKKEKVSA